MVIAWVSELPAAGSARRRHIHISETEASAVFAVMGEARELPDFAVNPM
jgi:hypothetical protein